MTRIGTARTWRLALLAGALALPMLAAGSNEAWADWGRRGGYHQGGGWSGSGWHHRPHWGGGFAPGVALGLGIGAAAALATAPLYYAPRPYYYYYYAPPPVYYYPAPGYYYPYP